MAPKGGVSREVSAFAGTKRRIFWQNIQVVKEDLEIWENRSPTVCFLITSLCNQRRGSSFCNALGLAKLQIGVFPTTAFVPGRLAYYAHVPFRVCASYCCNIRSSLFLYSPWTLETYTASSSNSRGLLFPKRTKMEMEQKSMCHKNPRIWLWQREHILGILYVRNTKQSFPNYAHIMRRRKWDFSFHTFPILPPVNK